MSPYTGAMGRQQTFDTGAWTIGDDQFPLSFRKQRQATSKTDRLRDEPRIADCPRSLMMLPARSGEVMMLDSARSMCALIRPGGIPDRLSTYLVDMEINE